jgi:hypothetical protein
LAARSDHYRVFAQPGALSPVALEALLTQREEAHRRVAKFLGARNRGDASIDYYVYSRASEKGAFTGDVRHVELLGDAVHRALEPGFAGHGWDKDLVVLLRSTLGRPRHAALEVGLAVLASDGAYPMGAQKLAIRQAAAGYALRLEELLDDALLAWEHDFGGALRARAEVPRRLSPLFFEPQSAVLVAWLQSEWGVEGFLDRYGNWSPSAAEVRVLEPRWASHLASLAADGGGAWTPRQTKGAAHPFRGANHTHEPLRTLTGGYLSPESDAMLERLASLGASAVAVVPYTYFTRGDLPTTLPILRSPLKENDESVVRVIQTAHRLGMTVMLKPQIQAVWPGDITMRSDASWGKFFVHYERWIRHYAMLAELNKVELLCVGVELVQATDGHEDAWRQMAGRLRRIYSGELVYAANWGEEFERLEFWDAFDYLGVNAYYPLSLELDPSDAELTAGARQVVDGLHRVQQRHGKPLLITELGSASVPAAWREPWKDSARGGADPKAQARTLEALLGALNGQHWIAGAFLWKWPSGPAYGGPWDRSHILAGKPAERVMAQWMKRGGALGLGNRVFP